MALLFTPARREVDPTSGLPLINGTLHVFANGTTTLASIYSNPGLTTALANPITLDAGIPAANIYVADGTSYTVEVRTSAGAVVWTRNDVFGWATSAAIDASTVDHDALNNYVADEHIDHSSVTITAGAGLSYSAGGADISADATLDVDVNSLTEAAEIAPSTDMFAMYDASASAMRKVQADAILGNRLGDGCWYRSAAVDVTSTAATLVYDTEQYDELQRGTFAIGTGIYTAGTSGARIEITASARLETQQTQDVFYLEIQVAGTAVKRDAETNHSGAGVGEIAIVQATTRLSLTAGQQVRCRIANTSTAAVTTGLANTQVSITELA